MKALSRNTEALQGQRSGEYQRAYRVLDDSQTHVLQKAREYTRALNAAKLDKIFAKPFVCAMDNHKDSVCAMSTHTTSLSTLLSASCDGEIRVWDLSSKKTLWAIENAHQGFVEGLCVVPEGDYFFSCSRDKTIKKWHCDIHNVGGGKNFNKPVQTYLGDNFFTCIDHHYEDARFATAGVNLQIWDENRSSPLHTINWNGDSGAGTIHAMRWNHIERHVMATAASDNTILLYDLRSYSPIRRLVLDMRSNSIAWNPMEAFHFIVANEDQNVYTFDMRNLSKARKIHMGHVAPVIDVDFSPSGVEFVSGSWDRTIRIFHREEQYAREVYYTKRMDKVNSVRFSRDANFVLSGSEDANIRLWKAFASKSLKTLNSSEKRKLNYSAKLVEDYSQFADVRRIVTRRHLPKSVFSKKKVKEIVFRKQREKHENIKRHSKPGTVKDVSIKEKKVVLEEA